ncbi:MAG: AraC family transcriptional regulator [Porticoccaceae bacterium]
MESMHSRAFKAKRPPQKRYLEGRLCDEAYDIQIHNVDWTEPGEATFEPMNFCFLELPYFHARHLYCGYDPQATRSTRQTIDSILLVPPGATLYTEWTRGHQRTLSCMFDLSKLGLLGGFEWCWQNIDLESTINIHNPFLEVLLRRLSEEAAAPGFASKLQTDSLLTLIAFELRRHYPRLGSPERADNGKLSPAQIQTLTDLVEASRGLGPSLVDLSAACGLQPRQLSEKFRNTLGVTLRQYVAESRIKKARTLLHDDQLLIKEVAYICGFQNAAAFTAAFRKATDMTPQEFREGKGLARH